MKAINLTIFFNDDLGLKEVHINSNDTTLPSNSELLKRISLCLLNAIEQNKEALMINDMLQELGIEVEKS